MNYFLTLFSHIPLWETMISFGFFTLTICLMLVYSNLSWILKSTVTIVSLVVFILAYQTITSSYGWPYSGSFPVEFEIIGIDIQTPIEGKSKGAIDYWFKLYDEKGKMISEEPRVYKSPYSKKRHEQALQLQDRLRKGERLFGVSPSDKNSGVFGLLKGRIGNPLYDDTEGIHIIDPPTELPSKSDGPDEDQAPPPSVPGDRT